MALASHQSSCTIFLSRKIRIEESGTWEATDSVQGTIASSNFQGKCGQPAYPLNKDPSFSKCFSTLHNIDNIRIPPEWVMQYRSDVPFQCVLFMPNGFCWTVRMLNIASGCHFNIGWKEFVIDNHIHNNDTLVFTHKGEGKFRVQRYDSVAGCPPQVDYDGGLYWEQQIEMEPDLDTSDDYCLSYEYV
ncbi:hypothetical protein AAHA92_10295 [Salvia divinorum]|uniref:TF-B3 domain-containing protein n=1 Tax=Salvia divinorum TaxID=28513 RepID=A0ABD1HU65_SALDI